MKSDLFELPSEIINNILLRLSVRSIAVSKCVCKPLLHLLGTHDFAKSHFSKSAPALAFTMRTNDSYRLKISELEEDEIDPESHDLLTNINFFPEAMVNFTAEASLGGSVNGLLFLFDYRNSCHYVSNPITREFFFIRCPRVMVVSHGFGVSRITGQHKLVCIDPFGDGRFNCYVYTLGTGSWRRVEANDSFGWTPKIVATFLNGNLHWMVWSDPYPMEQIFCFDLETECFSRFNVPPLRRSIMSRLLFTLRDCLCFCDDDEGDGTGRVVIWMMKEYGVEKSWTKEYVVTPNLAFLGHGLDKFPFQLLQPIKVFKNGDVLMLCGRKMFMYHSKHTKTTREIDGFFGQGEGFYYLNSLLLTPSLLPLKSFAGMENENVISF
ncbi:F-box/kelch-repeat protein At3g06240-like [Salvia miltiorrhiza]|uniref:F-box/kelch-repeat protein At3g06240-like n=1 Tax=Salvia miltiorrhiza TaxID=226208 RepID=UPI0025AB72B8|nr:F-box/kelch-repeat protein At3g06240-like [Salvia miltiorrhiza]